MLNGELIQELCRRRGLNSVSQLARRSGVHRNTVSSYLEGRLSPLTSSFQKICKALQVDGLQLLERLNTQERPDLLSQVADQLRGIAATFPRVAFVLFGSRLRKKHRRFSDLDIGLSAGNSGLTTEEYFKVRHRIEDRFEDFPVSIDVVNLDQAPQWFFEEMKEAPRYILGNENSFNYILGTIHAHQKSQEDSNR